MADFPVLQVSAASTIAGLRLLGELIRPRQTFGRRVVAYNRFFLQIQKVPSPQVCPFGNNHPPRVSSGIRHILFENHPVFATRRKMNVPNLLFLLRNLESLFPRRLQGRWVFHWSEVHQWSQARMRKTKQWNKAAKEMNLEQPACQIYGSVIDFSRPHLFLVRSHYGAPNLKPSDKVLRNALRNPLNIPSVPFIARA